MRDRDNWYTTQNPAKAARGFGWRAAVGITAGVVFFGALGIGIWKFRVETSDIKGAGDAQIEVNSGANRIAAQEKFVSLYNAIQKQDKDLDVLAATLASKPNEFNQTNYDSARMLCNAAVADYNALSNKVRAEKWRPESLPDQINTNDPRFDCKENTK